MLPNGVITCERGNAIAANYFNGQARLMPIHNCFLRTPAEPPACFVRARVQSAGYLLPSRSVTISAIGYLAWRHARRPIIID